MDEWISVKKQKPELGITVRVLVRKRRAVDAQEATAVRTKNGAWILPEGTVGRVTHWMPLPEPSEERD